MKSTAVTLVLLVAAGSAANAQTPVAPKPVATVPTSPAALQTPMNTAKALALPERTAIQSDLAWAGVYNGAINGEVSERMLTAIKTYQKDRGGKQTGVLNPQERSSLAAAARKIQTDAGWKIVADPISGVRLGIPAKLVPRTVSAANATGSKWTSAQGQIQIETWRVRDASLTIAGMAERERKEPAGRKVNYSVVRPDFFVLSGSQGLKKIYVRAHVNGGEIRGMTILYDQATEGSMEPVVIAMSSAFTPFPANAALDGPQPRRKVEYATGIVVGADGAIVTDRQAVDDCQFIVVPGHGNADRIAEHQDHGLALLRVYGAVGLKPVAMAEGPAKSAVHLVGIADPQNQGGAAAVTIVHATASPANGSAGSALSPAPGPGFAGAAAIDADGKFAGMALLRPAVIAGPSASASYQATLAPADHLLTFTKANGVAIATGPMDAKASVLRVICVRK